NVEALYASYFRTIFHEFSHIMNKTTDYPKEFRTIREKDYVGDYCNDAWKDEVSSMSRVFVSDNSYKEKNEDLVE
ncbi:putative zinc-binding metallopeptidase, partial [Ornithobacterium rhinotracheale]